MKIKTYRHSCEYEQESFTDTPIVSRGPVYTSGTCQFASVVIVVVVVYVNVTVRFSSSVS